MNAGEYYLKQMESVLNKGKIITKIKSNSLINKWQALLGISDWVIIYKPISENQVVDKHKGNTLGLIK